MCKSKKASERSAGFFVSCKICTIKDLVQHYGYPFKLFIGSAAEGLLDSMNLNGLKKLIEKVSEFGASPPQFPAWRAAVMVLVGSFVLGLLLHRISFLGWDWYLTFRAGGDIDFWYPGWTKLLTSPIGSLPWRWGLAFSNGLTLVALSIATLHESRNRWGATWRR